MHQYNPSKTVSRILLAGAVLFVACAFMNATLTYRWSSCQNFVCLFCHEKMSKVQNERGQTLANVARHNCSRSRRHAWIRLPESSELNVFNQSITVQTNWDRMWVYRATNDKLVEALVEHPEARDIRALLMRIETEDDRGKSGESGPPAFHELVQRYPTLTEPTRK